MPHPLEFFPQHLQKPIFYTFFALTLVIFGIFNSLDRPLKTDAAPSGIVSFELGQTVNNAQAIIDSWDAKARLYAAFGIGFDYLFMPVYALALSLGLLLASHDKKDGYRILAAWLGWGAFVAALFDMVENCALWKMLISGVFSPYPELAAFCASTKFMLLIAGLVIALAGRLFRK